MDIQVVGAIILTLEFVAISGFIYFWMLQGREDD